jgi:hypothetical protein
VFSRNMRGEKHVRTYTCVYVCAKRHGPNSDILCYVLQKSVSVCLITKSTTVRPPYFLNTIIIRSGNVGV